MRAKFVVPLEPISADSHPSDENVESRLRSIGIGMASLPNDYDDRRKVYLESADVEWSHLPELAEWERDRIVLFSTLSNQVRLMVTRPLEGEAVFRLIHDDLAELQRESVRLVENLGKKSGTLQALHVKDNLIEIYERGSARVILVGEIIEGSVRTTAKRHPGDIVVAGVTSVASIITFVILAFANLAPGSLPRGSVERFSTAMISSFFIALVGFVQHWLRLRRHGAIEWGPRE